MGRRIIIIKMMDTPIKIMSHKATMKSMQHNQKVHLHEQPHLNSAQTVIMCPSSRISFTQQVSRIPNDYLFHKPKPNPQKRLYSPFLDMSNPELYSPSASTNPRHKSAINESFK